MKEFEGEVPSFLKIKIARAAITTAPTATMIPMRTVELLLLLDFCESLLLAGVVVGGGVVADDAVEVDDDDAGMLEVLVAVELEEEVTEEREVEVVGRAEVAVVVEESGGRVVVIGRVEVSPGGGRT